MSNDDTIDLGRISADPELELNQYIENVGSMAMDAARAAIHEQREARRARQREYARRYRARKKAIREGREPPVRRGEGWPAEVKVSDIARIHASKNPYGVIFWAIEIAPDGDPFFVRRYKIKPETLLKAMAANPKDYKLRVRLARRWHWLDFVPLDRLKRKGAKRQLWWQGGTDGTATKNEDAP